MFSYLEGTMNHPDGSQYSGVMNYAVEDFISQEIDLALAKQRSEDNSWKELIERRVELSKNLMTMHPHCDNHDYFKQKYEDEIKRFDDIISTITKDTKD